MAIGLDVSAQVERCIFSGHDGPCIWAPSDKLVTVRDCLFIAPESLGNVDGWAVYARQNALITNNTIVGRGLDTAAWDRAVYFEWSFPQSQSRVSNNIIVATKEAIHVGDSHYAIDMLDMPIEYNCFDNVQEIVGMGETYLGNDLWWIESKLSSFRNNVYHNPGFVAEDPTYHVGPSSSCVDSGDPNYAPDANKTDLDGRPRLAGHAVDKGAYELQTLPDIPPQLLKAVSRRTHGEIGVFDIELSLDPNELAVEGRVGGPAMIVLALSEPVYAADGSCDVGQEVLISDPNVAASATLNCVDDTVIIETGDLPDGTCLLITLEGLIDANAEETEEDTEVFLLVLRGDVNGDGAVDTLDVNQVNNALFEPVDVPGFQFDVNTDGEINELDMNAVKDSLGGTAVCL